jgi:hypothetical protein
MAGLELNMAGCPFQLKPYPGGWECVTSFLGFIFKKTFYAFLLRVKT